jgi:hypothetical protein
MVKLKCGTERRWKEWGGMLINIVVNCQDYNVDSGRTKYNFLN